MKKIRVTIRLYRMHDLDLITFVELHKLNIQKAVYCALTSFAKGELFLIKIPPRRAGGEELNLSRVYSFTVLFDAERDKNAILLLSKIADGRRNNFLKNLLRLYLCNPMSEMFLKDESDADFFYDKFAIFRSGRRMADLSEDDEKWNSVPPLEKLKVIRTNKNTTAVEKEKETSGHDAVNDNDITAENKTVPDTTESEERAQVNETQSDEGVPSERQPSDNPDDEDIMSMFSALL